MDLVQSDDLLGWKLQKLGFEASDVDVTRHTLEKHSGCLFYQRDGLVENDGRDAKRKDWIGIFSTFPISRSEEHSDDKHADRAQGIAKDVKIDGIDIVLRRRTLRCLIALTLATAAMRVAMTAMGVAMTAMRVAMMTTPLSIRMEESHSQDIDDKTDGPHDHQRFFDLQIWRVKEPTNRLKRDEDADADEKNRVDQTRYRFGTDKSI